MPRTPPDAFQWARNEAQHGNVHDNWAGLCEALINWMYDFRAFPTALAAGDASGTLRTDYGNAPVGAIVYWSGVWVDGVECGHIATVYEAGANPLLVMASSAGSNWGRNIRQIRLTDYQRTFGHPLRGWSLRHGVQTADFSSTAGGGDVIPITPERLADMAEALIVTPDGHCVHVQPNVKVTFNSEEEYSNYVTIASWSTNGAPDGSADKSGNLFVPPAKVDRVMKVTWDGFTQVCRHFNVPTDRDTVPQGVPVAQAAVIYTPEQIAKAVADELAARIKG